MCLLSAVTVETVVRYAPAVAIVVSIWRITVAQRNNMIAATNPWIGMVMEHVKRELDAVQKDSDLFSQLCENPFVDVAAKKKWCEQLNEVRDQSARILYWLTQLAPGFKPLNDLKVRMLSIHDSYLDNDAIQLSPETGQRLLKEYQAAAGDYIAKIRDITSDSRQFKGTKWQWPWKRNSH
jgi:hypothetical protein